MKPEDIKVGQICTGRLDKTYTIIIEAVLTNAIQYRYLTASDRPSLVGKSFNQDLIAFLKDIALVYTVEGFEV